MRNIYIYTGYTQQNGAVSKVNPLNAELNPVCHLLALLGAHPILHISKIRVNKKFIFQLTRAQLTLSVAATVQVSHAYCGASFQDGVAAGKDFLCAPF